MSSWKEKEAEKDRLAGNAELEDSPPPYTEGPSLGQPQFSAPSNAPPQGQGFHEGENKLYDEKGKPPAAPPGYDNGYDPLQDPNVYKVKPQKVDISRANPDHLHPSYIQFQERERERMMTGDYSKPMQLYVHGAPLPEGKVNPKSKTGGGAFPGRSGATYDDAANR